MNNLFLILALLLSTSQWARADVPQEQLIGVRIWIGSSTMEGYTPYSVLDFQELKKDNPTLDELLSFNMKQGKSMRLFAQIKKVSYPHPMFVSPVAWSQLIPRRLITKWERVPMPYDREKISGPSNVVPLLALELLNRPPLFSCTEKDGGTQWLSYSPEWDANSMKELCENPKTEKAERMRKYMRSVPDVFELQFPEQD